MPPSLHSLISSRDSPLISANPLHSDRDPRPAARAAREPEDGGIAPLHDRLALPEDPNVGLRCLSRKPVKLPRLRFPDADRRRHDLPRPGRSRRGKTDNLHKLLVGVDHDLPGQILRIERLEGEDRGVVIDPSIAARRLRNIRVPPLDQKPPDGLPGRCRFPALNGAPEEGERDKPPEKPNPQGAQGRPPIEYSRPQLPQSCVKLDALALARDWPEAVFPGAA